MNGALLATQNEVRKVSVGLGMAELEKWLAIPSTAKQHPSSHCQLKLKA